MNSFVRPTGNPDSLIWLLCETPLEKDTEKGFLYSSSLGGIMMKMIQEAGIKDIFYLAKHPDLEIKGVTVDYKASLNIKKPPLIISVGSIGPELLSELKVDGNRSEENLLNKYVGSLLQSRDLKYPHYVMPLYTPMYYTQHWDERNVSRFFDLQKLREEYNFYKSNLKIQPLKERKLIYEDLPLDKLLTYLHWLSQFSMLSVDIETIYPRDKSEFINIHPGVPITIGIAPSSKWGISFSLFRDSIIETVILWRELNRLLSNPKIQILGQNFFGFDIHFLRALGFDISENQVIDTMIRHHILWPELSHKLQFMTRQYTREPFYKDEGQGWSPKDMSKLRRYNCLDVTVTYEVWEQQEEEFQDRRMLA